MKDLFDSNEMKYLCPNCNKQYKTSDGIQRHKKVHEFSFDSEDQLPASGKDHVAICRTFMKCTLLLRDTNDAHSNRVTTNVKLHMLLSRHGKTQQVSVQVFGLHQMNLITNNGVRVHVEFLCKLGGMGKIFQIYNLQDIMFRELYSWLKLKRKLNNRICKPSATRKNWDREKHLTFWKWSLN